LSFSSGLKRRRGRLVMLLFLGGGKVAYLIPLLGTFRLTQNTHVVAIEKFDGDFIRFESSEIEVLKHIQGDTNENTMLWIPGQGILIAGDVVVNNMHLYTAETDSKARGKWLNSLNKIRELKPSVVIPGHSKVGAPLDASTAVDFTENYLLVFEEELKKAKDPDSLINTMKERFPSAGFVLAIERGAKANVKPSQTN
jgi:glyoxylase-like metal-dependent hydrolase (beta-lactamase superfamily II)